MSENRIMKPGKAGEVALPTADFCPLSSDIRILRGPQQHFDNNRKGDEGSQRASQIRKDHH
jgi:hypothetical protein